MAIVSPVARGMYYDREVELVDAYVFTVGNEIVKPIDTYIIEFLDSGKRKGVRSDDKHLKLWIDTGRFLWD